MQQHHHSLDDFLQSKVEEADFSYKADYWEKMSTLLDEQDQKKRFPFFWRGLSILAALVVLSVGAYLLPKFSFTKSEHSTASKTEASAKPNVMPSVKQDLPSPNNTSSSSTVSSSTHSSSNHTEINPIPITTPHHSNKSNNKNVATDSLHDLSPSDNPTLQKNTSFTKQTSATHDKPLEATTSTNKKTSPKKVEAPSAIQDESVATTDVKSKEVHRKRTKSNHLISNQASPLKDPAAEQKLSKKEKRKQRNLAKHMIAPTTTATPDATVSQPNTVAKRNDTPVQSSVSVQGKNMRALDTIQYSRKSADEQAKLNPRYMASLLNYIPERFDSVTIITYQPETVTKASTQTAAISTLSTPKTDFVKDPLRWMIMAGMYANKGLKGNVASPASWALSPYLGVGAQKQITPKITMAAHIGFTYFNGLNSEIEIQSTQYSFGLDSSSINIANKKLFQLYLPFTLYYQIAHNHFLMASIGAAYMLDVSSQVTEKSLSNNTGASGVPSRSIVSTTKTEGGYRTGFNRFDLFAQIGYSYQFNRNMMAQIGLQQGFFDMTKNSYFNNSLSETQTRLSIGLKYTFKRK